MISPDRVDRRGPPRAMLVWATSATLGLCVLVVATASGDDSALGAPPYWAWLLTGLQVTALWAAGTGRRWGWLVGGSVQLPWIAYALMTSQFGFIPGCLASASVQLYSFLRTGEPIIAKPRVRVCSGRFGGSMTTWRVIGAGEFRHPGHGDVRSRRWLYAYHRPVMPGGSRARSPVSSGGEAGSARRARKAS